jgi:hypothetical protein
LWERQTLFLPGDWDPAGFFDRLVARAGGFFGVAFRGTRAATGAAAATRLRERLGLVLSRGPAIVSAIGLSLNRSSGLLFQVESVLSFDGFCIQRV